MTEAVINSLNDFSTFKFKGQWLIPALRGFYRYITSPDASIECPYCTFGIDSQKLLERLAFDYFTDNNRRLQCARYIYQCNNCKEVWRKDMIEGFDNQVYKQSILTGVTKDEVALLQKLWRDKVPDEAFEDTERRMDHCPNDYSAPEEQQPLTLTTYEYVDERGAKVKAKEQQYQCRTCGYKWKLRWIASFDGIPVYVCNYTVRPPVAPTEESVGMADAAVKEMEARVEALRQNMIARNERMGISGVIPEKGEGSASGVSEKEVEDITKRMEERNKRMKKYE